MRVAVIGSRGVSVPDLSVYIPAGTTAIVSGGAKGVDMSARAYAVERGIHLIEFFPEYRKYGKAAPLRRNIEIIQYADCVLAFWDGESRGTAFVIQKCKEMGKPCQVYMCNKALGEA